MNDVRPTYETQGDKDNERAIAARLGLAWNCRVVKLPRAYNLDYAALRGEAVMAWLEIKRRFRDFNEYPTCFLSMHKLLAAYQFHTVTGLQCLFIVQFNDCLVYADILACPKVINFNGRYDRNDWQDQEPLLMIANQNFFAVC